MSKRSGWTVLLALSVALAACGREGVREDDVTLPEPEPETNTVVDVLAGEGFTTLVSALEAADLGDTLRSEGPFTIFAPTDAAFEALPDGVLDDLLADPAALTELLEYHLLDSIVGADVLSEVEGSFQSTVQGAPVAVTFGEEDALVALNGSATVRESDLLADNGVVHGVDAVLMPPVTEYIAELNSESEVVPPDAGYDEVESGATGSVTASLDLGTETPVLSMTGDFSGLTSPLFAVGDGDDATAGHLHGPATQSENAGVLFPLNISGDGGETPATLSAELELTPETFGYLVSGLTYVNIHTETYPAGEIRGQIVAPEVVPEATGGR